MAYRAINPATEEPLQEYPELSWEETKDLAQKSREAYGRWKRLSFEERGTFFLRLATLLRSGKGKWADRITTEMGKITKEAVAEVEKCAWASEFYAEEASCFLKEEPVASRAGKSYVTYEPLGTVLGIMPWNFPFWAVFRFAVPVMMAGNVCLLKHAPNVPGCALAIEALFHKAGFPAGVFSNLFLDNKTCAKLIASDWIEAVSLTGSTRAGREVAALAGQHLKKIVLELGGSDPFVILEEADLEKTVPIAVQARMLNAGQSCIAAKRLIIHQKLFSKFETELTKVVRGFKVGDPKHPETDIGPIAKKDLFDNLVRQVEGAKREGARLVLGGNRCGSKGYYYAPTILSDVKSGTLPFQEEVFGPVASLIRADSDAEAIRLANKTAYGLGASLWTQDLKKGEALAKEIEAGAVFINGMTHSDPRLPLGGIKQSGYGRELGAAGIREFTNMKTVWIA